MSGLNWVGGAVPDAPKPWQGAPTCASGHVNGDECQQKDQTRANQGQDQRDVPHNALDRVIGHGCILVGSGCGHVFFLQSGSA
ncbi:MAG: hypothetical protein ABI343_08950, partial [Burkholderiaceae bacterium]